MEPTEKTNLINKQEQPPPPPLPIRDYQKLINDCKHVQLSPKLDKLDENRLKNGKKCIIL